MASNKVNRHLTPTNGQFFSSKTATVGAFFGQFDQNQIFSLKSECRES
jgi:hypothetical protein